MRSEAVEQVRADPAHRLQPAPQPAQIGGVETDGLAGFGHDVATQRLDGDPARAFPHGGRPRAPHGPVADETELTVARRGALIDHAADCFREGRVANAVQDHLGDRGLARRRVTARFVIDRLRQAIEVVGGVQRARRSERPGGRAAHGDRGGKGGAKGHMVNAVRVGRGRGSRLPEGCVRESGGRRVGEPLAVIRCAGAMSLAVGDQGAAKDASQAAGDQYGADQRARFTARLRERKQRFRVLCDESESAP